MSETECCEYRVAKPHEAIQVPDGARFYGFRKWWAVVEIRKSPSFNLSDEPIVLIKVLEKGSLSHVQKLRFPVIVKSLYLPIK